MSESGGASGAEDEPTPYTFAEISKRFTDYIEKERPGLKRFYRWETQSEFDQYLKGPVTRGLAMAQNLTDNGCAWEVAMELSLLALYDLVMLIDNSLFLGIDEGGDRDKTLSETLSDTLRAISAVYSFVAEGGITAVRFLNTSSKYFNVTLDKVSAITEGIVFEGLASIGTKLRDKVLVNHVTPDMTKPLLVVALTGSEIEGEVTGLLRDVIANQAAELRENYGDYGPQAVAYQFANIVNGKAAQDLLAGLHGDKILGSYIDCLGNEYRLEDILQELPVVTLPKLLLGAISPNWDVATTSNATMQNEDGKPAPRSPDNEDNLEG